MELRRIADPRLARLQLFVVGRLIRLARRYIADLLKSERPLITLCFHETVSSMKRKCVVLTSFTPDEAVLFHTGCEKCGLMRSHAR